MITDSPRPSGTLFSRATQKAALHVRLSDLGPHVPHYVAYCLFHLFAAPILALRGLLLARRRGYAGITGVRLSGGSRPPRPDAWTLVISTYLGETRTALRAAEEIREEYGQPVAVLTSTAEAFTSAQDFAQECPVGIAPFNNPISTILMLLRWRPRTILFVEYCGLHHLTFLAKLLGIPTILFNLRLSEDDRKHFARRYGRTWRNALIDTVAVESEAHRQKLLAIGIEEKQILVTGPSLAIPALPAPETVQAKWQRFVRRSGPSAIVIVAGSTHREEEPILLSAFQKLLLEQPEALLVLAPRALQRVQECEALVQQDGLAAVRRSAVTEVPPSAQVLLLDTMGELREIYSVATAAFIGGSFVPSAGGHTPLEALAWNLPLTIGPQFAAQEALIALLEQAGIATVCCTAEDLHRVWQRMAQDRAFRDAVAEQSLCLRIRQAHIYAALYANTLQAQPHSPI